MKQLLKKIYKAFPFKQQLFSLVKMLWTPPETLYRHLYFNGIFTVKVDAQHPFKLMHYGYAVENQIFWEGLANGWEKYSMQLWKHLVQKSQVIFDIGANTGVYTLVAKAVNSNAEVHGFEPFPSIFKKYQQNLSLNTYRVEANKLAVSNNNGQAVIYSADADFAYSVTVNQNLWAGADAHKIEIETITLDSYIKQKGLGKIDLVKVDVETHEPEVIEGFKEHLQLFRPIFLIEVLNQDVADKLEPYFADGSWRYFNIDEKTGIRPAITITKSDYYNFLFVPQEKIDLLNAKDLISNY